MALLTINNYLVKGGQNFNDPPIVIGESTPEEAISVLQEAFDQFNGLARDATSFLSLPVNEKYRMFVRQYWNEEEGERPSAYYVGFLIERSMVESVDSLEQLDRTLISLDEEMLQESWQSSLPISCPVEAAPLSPPSSDSDIALPKQPFVFYCVDEEAYQDCLYQAYRLLAQDNNWFTKSYFLVLKQAEGYLVYVGDSQHLNSVCWDSPVPHEPQPHQEHLSPVKNRMPAKPSLWKTIQNNQGILVATAAVVVLCGITILKVSKRR